MPNDINNLKEILVTRLERNNHGQHDVDCSSGVPIIYFRISGITLSYIGKIFKI